RSYSFLLANQKLQDFNAKGTGVELLDREYPLEFDLEQNYPNPFNPQTTIRFHLPESGEMSLQIFTITGAAIRVLDQGFHDRGHYVRTWDGRDLHQQPVPSGVYYYQLRTSRSTITRKMILLR
ncbi:T9SS type A sorting domain-containing protein, partial [candidate division KSB1 bacterium]|nr:T9SS type A sorting domain-containing protein [candidate division KSB1 bacterium]